MKLDKIRFKLGGDWYDTWWLAISERFDDHPRYLEGLAKLSQRKSPWEDDECTHST